MDEMSSPTPEQPIQSPHYYEYNSPTTLNSLLRSQRFLIAGLTLLVLIILGGGVLLLGRTSTTKRPIAPSPAIYIPPTITPTPLIYPTSYPDETSTPTPPLSLSITPITTTLKTYTGSYVSFRYPAAWSPQSGYLGGGVTLENIILGIPNVSGDQTVSFSDVSVTDARSKDIVQETPITLGKKKGYKWIRKGSNYVSYDYITSGYQNQGSFVINVTLSREDKTIETLLDSLAASVTFK